MMAKAVRGVVGCIAGVGLAFALVIGVELFSAVVHPVPADFDRSMQEMCAHVAAYPAWVLAVVVPMWGGTVLVSTWLAGRIGGLPPAVVVASLLLGAVGWNVSMLPYPVWFEIAVIAACLLAVRVAVGWVRRGSVKQA